MLRMSLSPQVPVRPLESRDVSVPFLWMLTRGSEIAALGHGCPAEVPGREQEHKQPVPLNTTLPISHQTLSPNLHQQPVLPTSPPRPSSLHLDELGPWQQLPLGSSEVKQDDRSATLGQAGAQAEAQVAPAPGHQNLLPRGLHSCGLSCLLWCWWGSCLWFTGFGSRPRPCPWPRQWHGSWPRY